MPNWGAVQNEIQKLTLERNMPEPGPLDVIRRKYLKALSEYTHRHVIAYYSGFIQRAQPSLQATVFDGDINAFMNAINGLVDRSKGLDLLLHTPGGSVTATESIVNYLHSEFDDIRCFIPQLAMSAGTMIACSCKEIYMGKQSSIGPIDPQFGSIPAYGVLEEFDRATLDIAKNPTSVPLWQVIFGKIDPSFLTECQCAIDLSSELLTKWLTHGMFAGSATVDADTKRVVDALNNHKGTKTHGRHINIDSAIELGLKIRKLEDDNRLQDLVLTVHHAYMETFNQSRACKIVENQDSQTTVINVNE